MNKIAKYLNKFIAGTVYDASSVLGGYATDKSILKITPKVVAVPISTHDVRKLVRFSNQLALKNYKLPITVRGSGLDKTGAAIGSGMIISMEKMNRIQEIDPRQRLVRVQAGVTIEQLNSALGLHSLAFPCFGNPKQTIGGLIANTYADFSTGTKHGIAPLGNFIAQMEVVLSTGDVLQTDSLSPRKLNRIQGSVEFEGEVYRKISNLADDNPDIVSEPHGRILSHVKSKRGMLNLMPLFFGSQGTLGVISEVILHCDIIQDNRQYFVANFTSATPALDFIDAAKNVDPEAVNFYDVTLFNEALESGKKFRPFNKMPENGVTVSVVVNGDSPRKVNKKLKQLESLLNKSTKHTISTPENYGDFVELDSILSIYLNSLPRAVRAPIADDVYIPNRNLKKYFTSIADLEKKFKTSLPVFGSALQKNYSIRPEIDLTSVTGRQFVLSFLREYNDLVTSCDGKLAGGSPEGRLKAICANTHLSPELKAISKEIKDIFDLNGILNPGIKQDATLRAVVRELRTSYTPGIITE